MTEKLKGSLIAPVLMTSTSVTGSPCLCLDKRHCLSAKSMLPISITELCRKPCHREPITHLKVIKTGSTKWFLSCLMSWRLFISPHTTWH